MSDESFMKAAITDAEEGLAQKHGGPFGAAVMKEGKLIATGHNTVLRDSDPTCHAEVNAIRNACRELGTHVLEGCTLYTTAEPCPMCLSAILWARVERVVVGVDRSTAAEYGFDDAEFYRQVALAPEQRATPSTYGCCQKECEALFDNWKEEAGELY